MYTSAIRTVISKTGPTVRDLLPASNPLPGNGPQPDNSLPPVSSRGHAKARFSLTSVNNWTDLIRTGTGEARTTIVLSNTSNKTGTGQLAQAGAGPAEQGQVERGEGKGMMVSVYSKITIFPDSK